MILIFKVQLSKSKFHTKKMAAMEPIKQVQTDYYAKYSFYPHENLELACLIEMIPLTMGRN